MTFARYPSLSGRVVFVTGGASGIGADIVRAFAENGSKVAFVDILDEDAGALVAELANAEYSPLYLHCDLVDIPAVQASIEEVGRRLGPIGVLVNNAGNDDRKPIEDI